MPCPAPLESTAATEPWLSVLMPTYNGARYVATALESVAAQVDDCPRGSAGLEVIVVDDGSTDATPAIVASFADRLPLRIVATPRTGNWAANTNLALAQSRGRYIGFLHQDDCWLPGRLVRLHAALASHAQADPALVVHPARFIDASGRPLGTWRCPLPKTGGLVDAETVVARLLVQNFLAIPAPLFRRDAVVQVGGFDENLWYAADWDLWLKLAALGPCLYVPEPLACFRVHSLSQTASRTANSVEFRRQLEVVLQRHLSSARQAHAGNGRRLARVAQFSIDVNTALAAASHGGPLRLTALTWRGLLLGPWGWWQYWRDSRIGERAGARLRARKDSGE